MVVGVPRLLLTWQLILNLDAIDSSRRKDSAAYSNYTLSLRLICRQDWRERWIEILVSVACLRGAFLIRSIKCAQNLFTLKCVPICWFMFISGSTVILRVYLLL